MSQRLSVQRVWLRRLWASVSRDLLLGLAFSVLCLWVFVRLALDVMGGEALLFDAQVIEVVRSRTQPWLTAVMLAVTTLGEWWAMAAIGGSVGVYWARGRAWGKVVALASCGVGGALLNQLLKVLYQRPRPDELGRLATASGFSFPSGHAMMSFCFYVMLVYLLVFNRSTWQRALAMLGALALVGLIGLSRVYLGVHYPSDVLAGYAAATVWLLVNILVYRTYLYRVRTRAALPV
jgi:membrane-associated phospholipid phosphatase